MPSSPAAARPLRLLLLLLFVGVVVHTHAFQPLPPAPRPLRHIPHRRATSPSPPRPLVPPLAAQPSSSSNDGGGSGLFRLIRNDALSLAVGSLCLLALVANRLATPELYDSQSRTDIVGVISAGGLLLNGLTLQDVAVREAEAVELQGEPVDAVDTARLSPRQAGVLRWAADTYMQAFPSTASVLVWHRGATLLRKGTMPSTPQGEGGGGGDVEVLAIAQKALTAVPEADGLSQPTYIPDLQVLPGRVEFATYLPANCQGVLLQPFDGNQGLVILGLNRKRDLTPRDLNQARTVAQKVQSAVVGVGAGAGGVVSS